MHGRKGGFLCRLAEFLLLAVSVLVLFGVGQRVLDKMRLTDRQALFFMALILVGAGFPRSR